MPTPYEYRLMQWEQANRRRADQEAQREARRAEQQAYQQQLQQQYFAYQQQLLAQQRADALNQEYQKQQDQFRRDVENRYLDILGGRKETRERALSDLQNFGQSQLADTNARFDALASQANADVYSRGFGGSPGMLLSGRRSVEDARAKALNRVNDDIINRRVGADVDLSNQLYGFMERRTDVPPDLTQLIALQQGLGATGPMFGFPGGARPGTLPIQPGPAPPWSWGRPNPPTNSLQRDQLGIGLVPYGGFGGGAPGYGFGGQSPFAGASMLSFPQPDPVGPSMIDPRVSAAQQAELARRGTMVGLKQARESGGGAFGGRLQREREMQNLAILQGFANWSPGQPVGTIPGAFSGPIGAPQLMPNPPINYWNRRLPASAYRYGGLR